jgi:hypothetical protein
VPKARLTVRAEEGQKDMTANRIPAKRREMLIKVYKK